MNVATEPASLAVSGSSATPGAVDESALCAERPFPGLRPFGYTDRDYFFGRERQVFALYRLVEHGRFIAVIGSSGSGKSSLVLAGLRRLLADETADPGGPNWACVEMRPGAAPLSRLANALARLSGDVGDEASRRRDRIEYRLRQSSFSLEEALAEAGGLKERSLLLIIDQFEELFRFGLAGLGSRRGGVEDTRAREEATQFVQILLDADRRRIQNVRVLITMRSDFIGDCAYFHGLSEAVSATQYLVPNLTRGQLEDAICKPIRKAGGSIEPELVERLINDCGDELDQLPVLQHCLMRLWDRAGGTAAEPCARRLTRQTYDDIGRMADALSRHADEILAQCAGKELAVEQAFRALSELDREGRAIRRGLRFDKLIAETGVAESDLRAVLDRFRAPNCSFLLPSLSATPTLAGEERIDIGHEALLRRWKAIAGTTQKVDAKTGHPVAGWLGEEQIDGQRYRTLVSLLDDAAGGEQATLNDPDRTKAWWESLPRTAAWADRYGGRFEAVKKLIDDSIAAKQRAREAEARARRNRIAGRAMVGAGVLVVGMLFAWQAYDAARRQQQAANIGAMLAAKEMFDEFLDSYTKGNITEAGSRSLSQMVENFVSRARGSNDTPDADKLWVQSLNIESDLSTNFDDQEKALKLAREAKQISQHLVEAAPKDAAALQANYESLSRVGDALMIPPFRNEDVDVAFQEYSDALKSALALAKLDSSERPNDDAVKIHLKLGDTYRKRNPSSPEQALRQYSKALEIGEDMVASHPSDKDALRDRANAFYRSGLVFVDTGSWDRAYDAFNHARLDQEALVERFSDDETLKSNLAATYTKLADLWVTKNALIEAVAAYDRGVALQEKIIANDPLAPRYHIWLDPDYGKLVNVLDRLNLTKEARAARRKTYDNLRELAQIDPSKAQWQATYARAAKGMGDHSKGEYQLSLYREALGAWTKLRQLPTWQDLPLGSYYDYIQMAGAFAASPDWTCAKTAYEEAAKAAEVNLASAPNDLDWRNKADAAAAGAAKAAQALSGQPADAPRQEPASPAH